MAEDDDEKNLPEDLKRLSLWLSFWKFVLVSFVLAVLTAILNYQIQSRTVTIKAKEQEEQYLKSFIAQAMDDNLEKRVRFAQYFATLLKSGWVDYHKELVQEFKDQKAQIAQDKEEQAKLRAAGAVDPQKADDLARRIAILEANVTPQLPLGADTAAWGFTVIINGEDLEVTDVLADWFGGREDPQDTGNTASGVNTRTNPEVLGCSLPMSGFKLPTFAVQRALSGSPLPKLPWKTPVTVTNLENNKTVTVQLIDLGPAKVSQSRIDLTPAAFAALGGNVKNHNLMRVSYRVIGGAKSLPGWNSLQNPK